MYPRNATVPERIAIGAVIQISDGAVQTSGVSVKVLPAGSTASAGGGSIAYEEGIVTYMPTQAETNYTSFILIAYKTGCMPVPATVVTSASNVAGHAGVDWAQVWNPTTTVGLSGTTIATTQKVDVETIKTQAVTAAAGVTFPTSIASPTNITAGTITTVTNLTNAPTNGDFTATMKASITAAVPTAITIADQVWDELLAGHVGVGSTGAALAAAGSAGDPWTTPLPGAYGAGTAGFIVGTNLDATVSSRLPTSSYTAPLSAADTRTALGMSAADLDDQLGALPTALENADALLTRDMSAVVEGSGRTPLQAFRALRNQWTNLAGTYTVYKENDVTVSWTSVLATDAAAVPIVGSNPA